VILNNDLLQALTGFRSEIIAELQSVNAVMSDIKYRLPAFSIPQTPSNFGESLLSEAEKLPSIISNFVPVAEGEAFFENISAFKDILEGELVGQVYNRMQEVLGNRRLVSSKNSPWLEVAVGKPMFQNPDLICLHKAYVLYNGTEGGVVCGVPGNNSLCDDLIIFDFKLKPSYEAFGQFVIHHLCLHEVIKNYCKRRAPITSRGALVHKDGIWLVRFQDLTPREIIKMRWTDAGSVAAFQEFYRERDETGLVLDEVCKELKHEVSEHTASHDHLSLLGAGKTGKVFRVFPVGDLRSMRAVKIVIGQKNIANLEYEAEVMKGLAGQGVAVTFVDFHIVSKNGIDGAGLIMEPVGTGTMNGKHLIFRLNFPPNFRLNYLRVLGLGFRV
jgi:hypothetical protein